MLSVILPASTHGQVETLFVREGASCWGAYDENALTVTMHSERNGDSEDLLDVACVNTVIHGGEVIFLPADLMPDEADIAASFYYELEIV